MRGLFKISKKMKQRSSLIILSPGERRFRRVEGIMSKSHASVILSVDEPTDKILIAAIAGGSQVAMRTLYDRHSTRVYRFILSIIGNARRAEDLLSEVFMDVWTQARRFEGRSQVSTWILSIARFTALSAIRRGDETALDGTTMELLEEDSRRHARRGRAQGGSERPGASPPELPPTVREMQNANALRHVNSPSNRARQCPRLPMPSV